MRPWATNAWGLELPMHEALSYSCISTIGLAIRLTTRHRRLVSSGSTSCCSARMCWLHRIIDQILLTEPTDPGSTVIIIGESQPVQNRNLSRLISNLMWQNWSSERATVFIVFNGVYSFTTERSTESSHQVKKGETISIQLLRFSHQGAHGCLVLLSEGPVLIHLTPSLSPFETGHCMTLVLCLSHWKPVLRFLPFMSLHCVHSDLHESILQESVSKKIHRLFIPCKLDQWVSHNTRQISPVIESQLTNTKVSRQPAGQ